MNEHECKAFLRHKTSVINPALLLKQDHVTVYTALQQEGEVNTLFLPICFPPHFYASKGLISHVVVLFL